MASRNAVTAAAAIVVGLAFAAIGLLRPAFLWDLGKLRTGREAIGDTGVAIFFVVLGVALVGAGVYLARRHAQSE